MVWTNENGNISFLPIADSGTTIGVETEISSGGSSFGPQIVAVGTDAFVTWEDSSSGNSEIMFKKITASGTGFASPEINLSNNSGNSFAPQIAASGSDVYVTWADVTIDPNGLDILLIASSDGGDSFGGLKKLNDAGISFGQQIAATATASYVVWSQDDGFLVDIFFTAGEVSDVDVKFDSAEYGISNSAVITVNDPNKSGDGTPNDTILVDLTSTTTPGGISLTLTEDANTGVFSGSAILTSGAIVPGSEIPVSPGDLLTASYTDAFGTQTAIATVFVIIVEFDFTQYDRGNHARITVTDQGANQLSVTDETITVTVTSDANPTGITLQLTEDDIDSGVFGGVLDTQSDLIFAVDFDGQIQIGSSVTITEPRSADITTGIDTIDVNVVSTSTPGGITLTLTETGDTTAIFSGILGVTGGATVPASDIHVEPGDVLSVTDVLTSNSLITPNPILSRGVIQVNVPVDTITVTYLGESDSADVVNAFGEGGGGGGISRAGFVVNVLAGSSAIGGGGGPPGPTITLGTVARYDSASETISLPQEIRDIVSNHDPYAPLDSITDIYEDFELPFSINENSFALGGYENTLERQTIKRGEPTEFNIIFYTNNEIAHTSLYFNLGPTRAIAGSDTQVLLYKDKPIEIIDPNGNIASATGSLNNEGDLKRVVTFSITFSDDIKWSNSDLVIRAWTDILSSGDTIIYDAIEVLRSEEEIAFEESIPEPEVEQLTSQHVPIWIKNNAAWWSQEMIDDSDFISGIEYLIQQKIILISDSGEVSNTTKEIPSWIKNNAGWWSENLITEKEFIDGLQWLISNGIIQVREAL